MSKLIKYNLEFLGETTTASSSFSLESATIVNCLASESIVSIPQSLPIGTVKEIRKLGTDETKIISIQFTNEYVNNSNVSSLSLINYGSFYIIEKITSTFWTVIQSANIFDIAKDDILKNDLTKPSLYGITTNGVTATWDSTKTEVLSIGALRISAPASGTGRYVDFNLYPMEVNRLNSNWNLTLSYLLSTNASGLVNVVLFDGTNELPIVIDNFVYSTSVQNNVGIVFPQTSLIYKLRFKFKDNAECVLHLADIHLGIKDVAVGAVIGNWTSYDCILAIQGGGTAPTYGTNVRLATWRRNGSSCDIKYDIMQTTAGTAGSNGIYTFSLPIGLTIDTSKFVQGVDILIGEAKIIIGASAFVGHVNYNSALPNVFRIMYQNPFGVLAFVRGDTAHLGNAIVQYSVSFSIPVSQWVSNINLVSDFQEFASTSDCATNIATDSSFANNYNGIDGGVLGAFAPSGTLSVNKHVRFKRPLQPSDIINLEFFNNSTKAWVPAFEGGSAMNFFDSGTTIVGCAINPLGGTDIQVRFFSKRDVGTAWSVGASAGDRWRVRKISNGNMSESPSKVYINKTTVPELVDLGAGIIESGSNANGSYIKYSDGTMVQQSIMGWTSGYTLDTGGVYPNQTSVQTFTLPVPFHTSYSLIPAIRSSVGSYTKQCHWWYLTIQTFGIRIESAHAGGEQTLTYIAMGRWRA
jgi:hypothetical protein